MKSKALLILLATGAIIALGALWLLPQRHQANNTLSVAISPYQDIAMLVNADPLKLTTKYGVHLKLVTMAWEDILPAIASAGPTVDVGFGSLTEYLTKYAKLNNGNSDPVLFIQPLYVYKGGGFITFNPDIRPLDAKSLEDKAMVSKFLQYRIGAQKQSIYEMMIFTLAQRANVPVTSLKLIDTPLNDGLLALQSGSLDITSAGLTQLTEAQKRGGRMVLSMEDAGFADVTGFITRKSVLDTKRTELENLIRIWFDCVGYVMSDMQANSKVSLDFLSKNAATQYTFDQYSTALSQEYLPRSLPELKSGLLTPGSKYDFVRIGGDISDYLLANKIITTKPPIPSPLLP
jgi:ABC-type nitrate/sulfonate/bicarbonate transport system substrate-binding protein